jgi:cell division GTPase FtsZ
MSTMSSAPPIVVVGTGGFGREAAGVINDINRATPQSWDLLLLFFGAQVLEESLGQSIASMPSSSARSHGAGTTVRITSEDVPPIVGAQGAM